MKMNAQMATTNQAQLSWIAQQTQLMAQSQNTSQSGMTGYTASSTAPVDTTYTRFH
jgi:hypothetical protein